MDEPDDQRIGVNLNTQKLHCLIVLHDDLGKVLSGKAGGAFFRAFVVEDRKTGKMLCNMRFRYTDGDGWMRLALDANKNHLGMAAKIEYLAGGVEDVMRKGLRVFSAGAEPPREAVVRFYPPDPDDAEKTLAWLIDQDLVETKQVDVHDAGGRKVPIKDA